MKHYKKYNSVIAISEKSNGNETVGDMWLETQSFSKTTPVSEIIEWGKNTSGKLIITIDESTASEDYPF